MAARYLVDRGDGVPALILAERQRILRDCIFGIDLDPVAVAIARSSLRLAMLEGAPPDSKGRRRPLSVDCPLPDVASNVICANSLLGPADLRSADREPAGPIEPLDWDADPVTAPGFDVFLGNP